MKLWEIALVRGRDLRKGDVFRVSSDLPWYPVIQRRVGDNGLVYISYRTTRPGPGQGVLTWCPDEFELAEMQRRRR